MAPIGKSALFRNRSDRDLPQPEEFGEAPNGELSVCQQVGRSNLPIETKAIILKALEEKPKEKKKSDVFRAIEARANEARQITNTTLEELEKVVQDALRATSTKILYRKVYRENGKIWKVVPSTVREPDHATRLRVLEIFIKPKPTGPKPKKASSRLGDQNNTADRLRDREEAMILNGNGNGNG